MEYKTLRKILCNAAASGKIVEAFVTFTAASLGFDEKEAELTRTFIFTSQEKAFNPDADDYSIFGDSLDCSSKSIRLESHMKDEKGGPDGWDIQNCGIVKYMLTSVYDRNMCVMGYYDTEEEASHAMWKDMAETVGCKPDELAAYIDAHGNDCSFDTSSAWLNKDGDSDWNVIPIFMDGEGIVDFYS